MRATHIVTFLAVLGHVQAIALSKLQRRASRNKKHRREPAWPSIGGDVGKGCMTVFVQQPASLPFQAVQPAPHPTRTVIVDVTTLTTTTLPSGVGGVAPGSGGPVQSQANTVSGTQASPVTASGVQGGSGDSDTSTAQGATVPPSSESTQPGSVSDKTGLTTNAGSSKPSVLTTTTGAASATSANSTTNATQQTGAASAGNHKAKGLTAADVVAAASVAGKVGWAKSWASARGGVPMSIPFIPMLWNDASERLSSWKSNVVANLAESNSLKVLFTFNEPEPEMCEHKQACMSVANAITAWRSHVEPYYGKAVLVSPSVCSEEAWGKPWLDQFLASAKSEGLHIDAIGLHWYGEPNQMELFQDYLTRMYPHFENRPIWLTEFGVKGSLTQQAAFYKEAVGWLNQQSFIAGYAAFLFGIEEPMYALTDGKGQINEAGQAYINA